MPPRPRYSKGCYACRRMKVKCDEQMPQCRRCTKGGRKCPGFPEITNFLSMNSDFPNQTPEPTPLRHSTCNASHPPLERQLNIQPSTDWVQYSLSYFFKNFVHPPRADGLGYLQFLPGLLSTQSDHVCLQDSLRAVAMASLANVSSTQSLHFKADQFYCRALRSVSASLQCYSDQDDAALLASIFLLQKREALSANMQATDPHERGLVNLLQIGAPRKPRSPPEVGLLWTIHARLQLRSMDGRRGCDDGLNALDLPTGAQRTPLESDLVRSYENVSKFRQEVRRIVRLRNNGLYEQSCASELELGKALDQAFRTERELLTWPLSLQKEDLPGKIEIAGAEEIGPGLKFATKAYIFVDLQDGCRWSVYWSSRIQLLCTIQEGLELVSQMGMQYSPSLSQEVIKLSIQSAADSICSAIPFMIGEIDSEGNPSIGQRGQALGAYFATRFLHIVNEIPFLPGQQRLWILDCLLKFGQVWGIGAALRARELGIQRLRLDDDMIL